MHNPHILHAKSCLISSQNLADYSSIRTQRRSGNALQICRGFSLDSHALASLPTLWDQRRLVSLARIVAVAETVGTPACFTRESALMVRGSALINSNPEICLHSIREGNTNHSKLPAIVLNNEIISPAIRVRRVCARTFSDDPDEVEGLTIASSMRVATDIGRFAPLREAFPELCLLLREVSGFDRRDMAGSLAREQDVKNQWLSALNNIPHGRGIRRARALINAISGACESLAEGAFLLLLHTHGVEDWVQQLELVVSGKTYFADFAIPSCKLIIEIDGRAKLGENDAEIHNSLRSLMERSNDIESLGWRVIHITAKDILFHPDQVYTYLRQVAPELFDPRAYISPVFRRR
ncbi:MAG: hypothetical protein CSA82_01675 [Actinobacteria bacterium]|nr:MAG: hypothetical protein CSA82_01675 [Actinomycetota bacterium]